MSVSDSITNSCRLLKKSTFVSSAISAYDQDSLKVPGGSIKSFKSEMTLCYSQDEKDMRNVYTNMLKDFSMGMSDRLQKFMLDSTPYITVDRAKTPMYDVCHMNMHSFWFAYGLMHSRKTCNTNVYDFISQSDTKTPTTPPHIPVAMALDKPSFITAADGFFVIREGSSYHSNFEFHMYHDEKERTLKMRFACFAGVLHKGRLPI
jgi:hypothetical protein